MLINFKFSNFLSFNEEQVFSMVAGKTRKNSDRIYKNRNLRLTKCETVFGANASGKSNLIEAFQFVQDMVTDGLPKGFSNKFFRQKEENQLSESFFEMEVLLGKKRVIYGFSIILKTGTIQKEYLYEVMPSGNRKEIFYRDLLQGTFSVGEYFKNKDGIDKIKMYGEDSTSDTEVLFLTMMNHGKSKMYQENEELKVLRCLYIWFRQFLTVSNPDSILTGYPYFSNSNLGEIAKILNALGTGISDLKIVEVPIDVIKNKIPDDLYNKVVSDLEKDKVKNEKDSQSIMLRSYKEFYTFEIDENGEIVIKTIEFCHESQSTYFNLKEESDGTARILDLIEILLKISDNSIFVIDEMDRCLHPALTTKVIELFLKMAEERNTQLIITSHESRLLATEILRNDEICFVVKNQKGESIINPLEKYQLRADKKVYAALFDGTLIDVIPQYNDDKIKNILLLDRQ